jgi:hypothetical protein
MIKKLWFPGRHHKGVSLYMEEPLIRKLIWYSWDPCSGSNSEPFSVNVVIGFREKLHELLFKSDLIFISNYMLLRLHDFKHTIYSKHRKNCKTKLSPTFSANSTSADTVWNISHVPLVQNCCVMRENHAKHFPLSCVEISLVIEDGQFLQTEQAGISSCGFLVSPRKFPNSTFIGTGLFPSKSFSTHHLSITLGLAIAQAVSRQRPTMVAWVQSWVRSCAICSGLGHFSLNTSVSPANSQPTDCSILTYHLRLL